MNETLTPCRPVAPVAAYLGGKRNLAQLLIERIGAVPHQAYVEPFVGMGGVFLRRPFRAKAEVINDLSTDVATLFRILQRHYQALMDMLRWQLTSRAEFERLLDEVKSFCTRAHHRVQQLVLLVVVDESGLIFLAVVHVLGPEALQRVVRTLVPHALDQQPHAVTGRVHLILSTSTGAARRHGAAPRRCWC